jgi:hypothetical protein
MLQFPVAIYRLHTNLTFADTFHYVPELRKIINAT